MTAVITTYKHNCAHCIFLGNYKDADLYFHDHKDDRGYTVIARFGDNESISCHSSIITMNEHLIEAIRRSIKNKLITPYKNEK